MFSIGLSQTFLVCPPLSSCTLLGKPLSPSGNKFLAFIRFFFFILPYLIQKFQDQAIYYLFKGPRKFLQGKDLRESGRHMQIVLIREGLPCNSLRAPLYLMSCPLWHPKKKLPIGRGERTLFHLKHPQGAKDPLRDLFPIVRHL